MPSSPFAIAASPDAVTHPPVPFEYFVDRLFRALAWAAAALIIVLVAYILWKIGRQAMPAIQKYHFNFLISSQYNVQELKFGILPDIWGTLYSSLLGVADRRLLRRHRRHLPDAELPAAAARIGVPADHRHAGRHPERRLRPVGHLRRHPGHPAGGELAQRTSRVGIPFFGTSLSGPGLLPAALVLAIMVLPTIAAISQDALNSVPYRTSEAAYGLGATHWEAILKVMLPTGRRRHLRRHRPRVSAAPSARPWPWPCSSATPTSEPVAVRPGRDAGRAARRRTSPRPVQAEVEVLMYAALVLLVITLVVNIVGTWASLHDHAAYRFRANA